MGVAEVVIVATILEDEDVNSLEVDLMEADIVALRKALSNVGIVDVEITYQKSVMRNLVDLSGHNYLILVFLPRVVLKINLLFLALPRLYRRRRSMIDSDS